MRPYHHPSAVFLLTRHRLEAFQCPGRHDDRHFPAGHDFLASTRAAEFAVCGGFPHPGAIHQRTFQSWLSAFRHGRGSHSGFLSSYSKAPPRGTPARSIYSHRTLEFPSKSPPPPGRGRLGPACRLDRRMARFVAPHALVFSARFFFSSCHEPRHCSADLCDHVHGPSVLGLRDFQLVPRGGLQQRQSGAHPNHARHHSNDRSIAGFVRHSGPTRKGTSRSCCFRFWCRRRIGDPKRRQVNPAGLWQRLEFSKHHPALDAWDWKTRARHADSHPWRCGAHRRRGLHRRNKLANPIHRLSTFRPIAISATPAKRTRRPLDPKINPPSRRYDPDFRNRHDRNPLSTRVAAREPVRQQGDHRAAGEPVRTHPLPLRLGSGRLGIPWPRSCRYRCRRPTPFRDFTRR